MLILNFIFLLNNRWKMYKVYDSQGNFMDKFPTYAQASNYKAAYGNYNWTIKQTKF